MFAFDRQRRAILLIGGDKSNDWNQWYEHNVPIADDRFDEHQERITQTSKQVRKRRKKGKPR